MTSAAWIALVVTAAIASLVVILALTKGRSADGRVTFGPFKFGIASLPEAKISDSETTTGGAVAESVGGAYIDGVKADGTLRAIAGKRNDDEKKG